MLQRLVFAFVLGFLLYACAETMTAPRNYVYYGEPRD